MPHRSVMRGHSRPKDGVLSHAYHPRVHDEAQHGTAYLCTCWSASWIAGSSPAMTVETSCRIRRHGRAQDRP